MKRFLTAVALFLLTFAAGITVIPFETQRVSAEEVSDGLVVNEDGSYSFYDNGKKVTGSLVNISESDGSASIYYFDESGNAVTSQLQALKVGSKTYRYYFGSDGKAYTNRWKSVTTSKGKKYWYYFKANGRAYQGTKDSSTGVADPKIVKISGSRYAFDSNGRALTGVQVINNKFYVFSSRGKLNTTKTNTLRKAAKYESGVTKLKKLLKKYGATYKKTTYVNYSCYGNGKDGTMVYSGFEVYIFKSATSGKVIFLQAVRTS
ncbi:MAG: hypothetical protein LUG99_07365 [Lachnospiraceae bacterium]|nr:hypothetical protein [Lachnospiraceae bacterium]